MHANRCDHCGGVYYTAQKTVNRTGHHTRGGAGMSDQPEGIDADMYQYVPNYRAGCDDGFKAGHSQGYNQGHADALGQLPCRLALVDQLRAENERQAAELRRFKEATEAIACTRGELCGRSASERMRRIAQCAIEGHMEAQAGQR